MKVRKIGTYLSRSRFIQVWYIDVYGGGWVLTLPNAFDDEPVDMFIYREERWKDIFTTEESGTVTPGGGGFILVPLTRMRDTWETYPFCLEYGSDNNYFLTK